LLTLRKNFWFKLSGICGIISPILTLSLILLAINNYQFFNWESNALSDLGIISGNTAAFFNFGLIGGGLLILFFSPGLLLFLEKSFFSKIRLLVFILACCFLISIGLFPENVKPIHYLVSVAFFVLLPISLFLISGSFYNTEQLFWSIFTLLIAVLVTLPWIAYFSTNFFKAVAIPEIISGLGVSFWSFTLGLKMLFVSTKKSYK
jgi:hypothetical membrane protein